MAYGLKACSCHPLSKNVISPVMTILFNPSVNQGKFPQRGDHDKFRGWIKCGSGEHCSQEMTRKIEEIITLGYEEKREEEEREEEEKKKDEKRKRGEKKKEEEKEEEEKKKRKEKKKR